MTEQTDIIHQINNKDSLKSQSGYKHHLLFVGLMFIAAFSVRMYHITSPPLDFHPTRQFHSIIVAQSIYYKMDDSLPEWKKNLSRINEKAMGQEEPPIMEYLAAYCYNVFGKEYLWIPRLWAILFWFVGGYFLYCISIKIANPRSAGLALFVFLFFPFGITLSRSFMPEPLMVMLFLAAINSMILYDRNPTMKRLVITAFLAGFAVFIKFVVIFPLFFAFAFLMIHHHGFNLIKNKSFILFALIISLIGLPYYVYVIFNSAQLKLAAQQDFTPQIIFTSWFWWNWITQIGRICGILPFVLTIVGIFRFRNPTYKTLFIGLFVGQGVFNLVFTYPTATHDYYQVAFFPIAALTIGMWGTNIHILLNYRKTAAMWLMGSFILLTLIVSVYLISRSPQNQPGQGLRRRLEIAASIVCGNQPLPKIISPDYQRVQRYRKIGQLTEHSDKTVILAYSYGFPLRYYGELAGVNWPITTPSIKRKLDHEPVSVTEVFSYIYQHNKPDYFIVTYLTEYHEQPKLNDFLRNHFPVLTEKEDYIIFDLRNPLTPITTACTSTKR
jgi:dolichyl-phosphate-mannose-protein mannosyltransferase